MNSRLDLALAIKADGLHLGSASIPAAQAASFLASFSKATGSEETGQALSLATHSESEIKQALEWGVDYVQLAPVFNPLSKPASRDPLGLEVVARATKNALPGSKASPLPVLAQGGITPERCADLIQIGCAGVAVTGAILQSPEPQLAAQAFRKALDKASTGL